MTVESDIINRGIALLELGRAREAERHFRRAIAGDPSHADARVLLARSLLQQERYAEAADAAHRALAEAPEDLGGLRVIAAAHLGLGEHEEALSALDMAMKLAPGWAGLHQQRAVTLTAAGRHDEALDSARWARQLDPEEPTAAAAEAAALCNLGRFAEARTAAMAALRLDPSDADAHALLGAIERRRGWGGQAVESSKQAVRLDPTEPFYRQQLALTMKARNPLYAALLRFEEGLSRVGVAPRMLTLLAPMLARSVLRPFQDQLWAQIALALVVALVILSWVLEPVMNAVLLLRPFSRALLPVAAKQATYAFLGYLSAAAACFGLGVVTGTGPWWTVSLGLALWAGSAGMTHLIGEGRRRLALAVQAVGAVLATAALLTTVLGLGAADPLSRLLVFSGIAALLFVMLA